MQAFLSVHARLTEAIHAMCAAQGPEALKNHAADALECLLGSDAGSPGPLDHLLGLRIQEHISLFGHMTFVRAVVAKYGLDHIVDEYASCQARRHTPIPAPPRRAPQIAINCATTVI